MCIEFKLTKGNGARQMVYAENTLKNSILKLNL